MYASAKPLFRWTIGPATADGFRCLRLSIDSFLRHYDCEPVVCYNGPEPDITCRKIDQKSYLTPLPVPPVGVAWKLYPPRLASDRHELVVDNDVVLNERLPQIDAFLSRDCTLLLCETSRTYGRFSSHVPAGLCVNSGLYGMPPGFDLGAAVSGYLGDGWERNAFGEHAESFTFDEQGLVAMALSGHGDCEFVPHTYVTNCETELVPGKGHHFIGLNRRAFHRPFRSWRLRDSKMYL